MDIDNVQDDLLEDKEEAQVQVRFITKLDIEVPETSFAVPDRLARYGLSEIINHLLGHTDKTSIRPYDFLIDGQFLRTDLKKYLAEHALSGEAGLTLEVVEAVPAPKSNSGPPHPDWISGIASHAGRYVVTSCYDGLIRVYTGQGEDAPVLSEESEAIACKGHSNAVTSVALFNAPQQGMQGWNTWVSGSKDRTARVWQFDEEAGKAVCVAVCKGHQESVEAVAAQGPRFCTAGWDNTVGLVLLRSLLSAGCPLPSALCSLLSALCSLIVPLLCRHAPFSLVCVNGIS
jgi:ribosome biogenesis protein YTM1